MHYAVPICSFKANKFIWRWSRSRYQKERKKKGKKKGTDLYDILLMFSFN